MATGTLIRPEPGTADSLLARWHLLSLDAPTVAALWTWFVARANHISLPLISPAAMALAVWMLYAADRLLDARGLGPRRPDASSDVARSHLELEARHLFHHRYRRFFLGFIFLAATVLGALLPRLNRAAIRLYLEEGALLYAWLFILHATRSAHRLPKEIAVGLFFGAAIFIPTVSRGDFAHSLGTRLALLPDAFLFAALCSLNCLFIYAWEHDAAVYRTCRNAHPTTRFAVRHLTGLGIGEIVAAAIVAVFDPVDAWPIATACALSAILLLLLNSRRRSLAGITLRAAADLALLTPLALLPFVR